MLKVLIERFSVGVFLTYKIETLATITIANNIKNVSNAGMLGRA